MANTRESLLNVVIHKS